MGKIIQLPPEIVARTAAGEVIERPASIVKELIENAIDANTKTIKIQIQKSGLRKIAVTDTGEGMDGQDILKCYKPHTTSKLTTNGDFFKIKSLGFRGEALASMATVGRLTIRSKQDKSLAGTEIKLENAQIINQIPLGMPTGTTVIVEDLFFNIPGRKNFLKRPQTEFRLILNVVVKNAMANPQIGFYLRHNKRVILDIPPNQTLEERTHSLLGRTIFQNLIPINHKDVYFEITGFISKPQIATEHNRNQFIFVNKRAIRNTFIASTIKKAYGTLLDKTTLPVFIVFLAVPPGSVDVNVHPRKETINFHNEAAITDLVTKAVKTHLEKFDITYNSDIFGFPLKTSLNQKASPYAFDTLKDVTDIWDMRKERIKMDDSGILQIHNVYLITQTPKGFLLIDQHAAHEKIIYEQLLKSFENQKKAAIQYKLPKSVVINLSVEETHILEENLEMLRNLGLDIDSFGKNTFKVNAVPGILRDQTIANIISELITDIAEGGRPRDINKKSLQTISYLACRSAIKAGEPLGPKERKDLVEKLMQTKTKYTCPHGRPAMIEIKLRDLHKMFKRH